MMDFGQIACSGHVLQCCDGGGGDDDDSGGRKLSWECITTAFISSHLFHSSNGSSSRLEKPEKENLSEIALASSRQFTCLSFLFDCQSVSVLHQSINIMMARNIRYDQYLPMSILLYYGDNYYCATILSFHGKTFPLVHGNDFPLLANNVMP